MFNGKCHIYWLSLFAMLFSASQLLAATIYVDNTLPLSCKGNYSIVNRNCSGSDGDVYTTVQGAINACSVGDVIYMRAGTYHEIDIDIPETKNGTMWTVGNFTTLASYPGEWAKIDGTGLNTEKEYRYQHIIRHPVSYVTGEFRHTTQYWLFERFEVTGGRCGFWLCGGPMKFRYLYVHDNGRDVGDDLVGGIFIFTATQNLIEYCCFKDNEIPGAPSGNNFNILFDADYKDTGGNGGTFDPSACVHQNEIRYNYISGSAQGIRLKGDQRFGYNDRDPRSSNTSLWQYKNFGDNIHHNILLDSTKAITWGQDFSQIHHNISNRYGEVIGKRDGAPILYNQLVYNNTFKGSDAAIIFRGAGTYSSFDNYYAKQGQSRAHIHVWAYNNIQTDRVSSEGYSAFSWMRDSNDDDWDASDTVAERNLAHNPPDVNYSYRMGNTSTGTGCDDENYTALAFNACSDSWRHTSGVLNWSVSDSGNNELYIGSSGADQYITNGSFAVAEDTTISDGGIGGNHPYLSGVILPSYIGATNPNDHAWVDGVMYKVTSTFWLRSQADGDPSWVEGGSSSGPSRPGQVEDFKSASSTH